MILDGKSAHAPPPDSETATYRPALHWATSAKRPRWAITHRQCRPQLVPAWGRLETLTKEEGLDGDNPIAQGASLPAATRSLTPEGYSSSGYPLIGISQN
jgi:hypothetical protein